MRRPSVRNDSSDAAEKQLTPLEVSLIEDQIVEVLKGIYDPEVPVNIYEMGLIYNLEVSDTGAVEVTMTLTSPACPVAESLPPEVEQKVRDVAGVTAVDLRLVWEPPWSLMMMSEAAKLELGFF
ncbi:MAG: DUF59 domain-containing protein [Armatimonadetes bacterium]|nr:DUF59 domain-containing protein [Armatimonadota bacterium]MDE2208027.1 DUF59 domain-containing protein [Armatimonadota bacterium]